MGQWKFVVRASKRLSRKGLANFLERELSSVGNGVRILSVGAGGEVQDLVCRCADEAGGVVVSSDIDASRAPDIIDDITKSSLPDESFDIVVMMEVLEHVSDPFAAASEVYRLLRPGGKLVLSSPFIFPIHDRPYDFFRYTKYGLKLVLSQFDELVIVERNTWAEAILVLFARAMGELRRAKRLLSPFIILLILLCLPGALLLGRLLRSDFLTTGYIVTGIKSQARRRVSETV